MTDHDVHIPVDEPARSARRRRGGVRSGLALYAIVLAVTFAAVAASARALFLHRHTTADPMRSIR